MTKEEISVLIPQWNEKQSHPPITKKKKKETMGVTICILL